MASSEPNLIQEKSPDPRKGTKKKGFASAFRAWGVAMLTTDQIEVLDRWRKFAASEDIEHVPDLTDDDAAAIACRTMIAAYCKNPERVEWSDLRKPLELAQDAFGFDHDYADQ